MQNKILSIMILALATLTANAQDDFDPTLPGEPNAQYKVTVGISHPDAGSVNGAGSFTTGREVNISKNDNRFPADADVFYHFKYWTLNGVVYSTESSFTYEVGTENANFVAVYEVLDPSEITSKVYVEMSPADASDNYTTSGQRYFEDNYAYMHCDVNSGFEFNGWYEDNRLVSTEMSFYYYVGENDVALTAKFTYNPSIPGEPENAGQTDVDNSMKGDVNNDNIVDVQDVVACVNAVLTNSGNNRADVNEDGQLDVQDVVTLVNIVLNK